MLGGVASLSTASTIVIRATFKNTTTAETTFKFNPPQTVFGLAINAEALQYLQFPCEWTNVTILSFRPQADNGLNNGNLLGLGMDNFQYEKDTAA